MMAAREQREQEGKTPADTGAVIVAAGSFTRMGGIPKQLALLDGKPVIAHTLLAFEQSPSVREIVLVARPEDRREMERICRDNAFSKLKAIADGGKTRQESTAAGIARLSPDAAYCAVHDGARPLVTPSVVEEVVGAARRYGAAAGAVRVKDTIKVADVARFIQATPERRSLWSVQTPQAFESALYRLALEDAREKGMDFTDDCQLVERLGCRVYLCEGDYANIKLTTPEDLPVAERLLQERRKRSEDWTPL